MKEGKRRLLNAAHYAAQQVAIEEAEESHWSNEGYEHPKRKAALDAMADAGFGRFFIGKFEDLKPVACGRAHTDQEDDSSWYDWAVFNMDEVKEYMRYMGEEIEDDSEDVIAHPRSTCPNCGKDNVVLTRDRDEPKTKCYKCYSYFTARHNDNILRICENASGLYRYSSGPGRTFSDGPWARISKRGTRVLVTARGGYDV